MTALVEGGSDLPLVAIVGTVPLLREALASSLEGIVDVRFFPANHGETGGLLTYLKPDAVVVDSDAEAELAAPFARRSNVPLVHVSLRTRKLRVLSEGAWEELENGSASAEEVRNILVGTLYGRRRRRERG